MTDVRQMIKKGMLPFKVSTTDAPHYTALHVYGFTWRYAEREAKRLFPIPKGRTLQTEAML